MPLLAAALLLAAPSLQLADASGAMHRLADYRGKVVLVNFWATWCVPCREEMPSIDKLKSSLKGKPFEVLFENDDGMPHNFIIVPPGKHMEIGTAAMRW